MNKKKYVILGIILLTITFFIGISYAIWQITLTQTEENSMTTACFRITFTDENDIHLLEAYPKSDTEGLALQPYTFTIENICNSPASFQVNLEDITNATKKLPLEYLKVSLNQTKGNILNTLESVTPTLKNATTSYKLTTGVLKPNTSKTYSLNLWIDENTPAIDETMEATFEGKVTIIATYQKDIPEVSIVSEEEQDTIKVEVTTNKTEEEYTYVYQLEGEEEITTSEPTHTFSNLEDGNYKVRVKVLFRSGILLEEKEETISVAYERVYISNTGNDTTGNGSIENPYASINPAYQKVKSGGSIILLNDIIATETANLNIENKEVNLTSNGDNIYSITKDNSFATQILDITNHNTVTTSNITFDGNNVISSAALIESHDSILNLNEGTTVQKNNNRGRNYPEASNNFGALGGGLFIYQSDLNINGANIINNKTSAQSGSWSHGAGLYLSVGNLNFISGNISYNENAGAIVNQIGGGIIFENGTFNMSGGTISHNTTPKGGGGVFLNSFKTNTTMIMTGGNISENIVKVISGMSWGGGIYAYRENGATTSSIVYLRGGVIENNTASTGPNTYADSGTQIIDER